MAKPKIEYPTMPKLYKVLRDGKSQSGGEFTWKTNGEINTLPNNPRNKGNRLCHCNVGFHLTTDWRRWYSFGDDVYTARVPGGQILVRADYDERDCEDKVVAEHVCLSEKNADPLAALLAAFSDDVKVVVEEAKVRTGSKNQRKVVPANCVRYTKGQYENYWGGSVPYVIGFTLSFSRYSWTDDSVCRAFFSSGQRILSILVKSVDDGISKEERKQVHDIWNLWKSGWAVHGLDDSGKYLVS